MQVKTNKNGKLQSNLSEINVTPLVDVMLVLLIIFMVTAPMMQSGIKVNLPTAETRSDPSSGGLVITITKDHYIYMDNQVINLFLLESRIKNFVWGDKKKIVFIKADKTVDYGFVVDVMDALKQAGVETVGMIVENKLKK